MREQRPIYIGPNPLTGSYRRNYEGDYKCTKQEVQIMLADQSSIAQDKYLEKVMPYLYQLWGPYPYGNNR